MVKRSRWSPNVSFNMARTSAAVVASPSGQRLSTSLLAQPANACGSHSTAAPCSRQAPYVHRLCNNSHKVGWKIRMLSSSYSLHCSLLHSSIMQYMEVGSCTLTSCFTDLFAATMDQLVPRVLNLVKCCPWWLSWLSFVLGPGGWRWQLLWCSVETLAPHKCLTGCT